MWIFSAGIGDPMLLDSRVGLEQLHQRVNAFIASADQTVVLPASFNGNPSPYDRFLPGLRITKTANDAQLRLADDNWLELIAPVIELLSFNQVILVTEETAHQHWYSTPMSLIIESDSIWVSELEG